MSATTIAGYAPKEYEKLALNNLGTTLRPEWIGMPPVSTWRHHLREHGGFEQADDFAHVVRAFTSYATGQHSTRLPRTPNLFVHPGEHWEATRMGADGD